MRRAAPWMVRLGGLLLLVSPFLPQVDSGGTPVGPWAVARRSASPANRIERLAAVAGLFAPVVAGAFLVAGASLPGGGPAALRLAGLGLVLVLSFALATLGSLLLTDGATRAVTPSFPLSLVLFTGPLVLSGIALSRWMQGGLAKATGAFERVALAVLLLLHGLFLADSGWGYLLLGPGVPNGIVHPLPGAWAGPLGALLAVAGGLLPGLLPRSAVDSAAASG